MEKRVDEEFMAEAVREARKAYRRKETPIGCVIVRDGKVIARGYNKRDHTHNVLAHAEIEAIRKACRKVRDWRLEGCKRECCQELETEAVDLGTA